MLEGIDDLKSYLSFPPLLAKPAPREEMFLYLATSPLVMSIVLIQEKARVQKPIYYISQILRDIETQSLLVCKSTSLILFVIFSLFFLFFSKVSTHGSVDTSKC